MYRNKPVKGFISPLIRSQAEIKENKVSLSQERAPSDSIREAPLRSNSKILNLFEKAIRENEIVRDNVEVESNPSKKRDASVYEKETSAVDSFRAEATIIFNVTYGKISRKEHKKWDGDGLLEVTGKRAVLKSLDGNVMGRATINASDMVEGFRLIIGSKQIEIIDQVSQELSAPEKHSEEVVKEPLQKKSKLSITPVLPMKQKDVGTLIHKEQVSRTGVDSSETKIKIIFNVMYGKVTTKKHKTWDGDGLLEVIGKSAVLKSLDGKVLGKGRINPNYAVESSRLIVGNKQIEIIDRVSQESLISEKQSEEIIKGLLQKKDETFTTPNLSSSTKELALDYEPLVMPYVNSSVVSISHEEQEVSVDSCLAAKLRKHQRHGIVFLYECLMGLKVPDHFGAILADEMGLGKTLQCIALIWTILRKGPYGKPIVRRVLIITPSSLCNNWDKEFVKWLGSHRIFPYVVNGKNKPKDFTKQLKNSVMIISYEMFVKYHDEINEITFDLIVCDEGHRLKNSNVKVAKLLCKINCRKRVILTGTPIQNDLKEFYALIDFVNPDVLGTPIEYKNYYEDPIVASQCPYAAEDVVSLGNERATELHERTKPFILRRTQEMIKKYLPHKYEIVLFCSLSSEQKNLYSLVTDVWFNKICLEDKSNTHLSIITALKKICNHPSLLVNDKENAFYDMLSRATCATQRKREENFTKYCGKITILQTLMRNLKETNEKLVLISYYTQTLDLLETVCSAEGLKSLRFDGSTSASSRSRITEQFNTRTDDRRILLLSAKAGGVGLNLSGASRLVLFDSDWNPASDMQAMARIWRDGQKKNVYIYRLLTTGTIEEKIYQRQISKAGLSESVVDLNHLGSLKLSTEELKDLFTLVTDTVSLTHDLMNCSCSGQNNNISPEKLKAEDNETRDCQFVLRDKSLQQNLTINQLRDWQHYKQPIPSDVMQEIMLSKVSDNITFIFKNSTIQHTYDN